MAFCSLPPSLISLANLYIAYSSIKHINQKNFNMAMSHLVVYFLVDILNRRNAKIVIKITVLQII